MSVLTKMEFGDRQSERENDVKRHAHGKKIAMHKPRRKI